MLNILSQANRIVLEFVEIFLNETMKRHLSNNLLQSLSSIFVFNLCLSCKNKQMNARQKSYIQNSVFSKLSQINCEYQLQKRPLCCVFLRKSDKPTHIQSYTCFHNSYQTKDICRKIKIAAILAHFNTMVYIEIKLQCPSSVYLHGVQRRLMSTKSVSFLN